jgi:3-isopropylmalate/(R)-2-methylmalate dehydratase small subunit
MEPFKNFTGSVAPLDRPNVDTDQIIPKQFLKAVVRSGLGAGLFFDWRKQPSSATEANASTRAPESATTGEPGPSAAGPNPERSPRGAHARSTENQFVLDRPRFSNTTILVARANFGCGSSREHAVWALADYGFRAVIAPSFADIFKNNCLKNGLLTVVLQPAEVDAIFAAIEQHDGYQLTVDLTAQTVSDEFGWKARFDMEPFPKKCLIEGLDDIALTLHHDREIAAYEKAHPVPYRF